MPRSTLFPYTTLFRSQVNPLVIDGVLYGVSPKLKLFALDAATGKAKWVFDPIAPVNGDTPKVAINACRGVAFYTADSGRDQDRKSTRLNSSHMSISYAEIYTLSLHDALPISGESVGDRWGVVWGEPEIETVCVGCGDGEGEVGVLSDRAGEWGYAQGCYQRLQGSGFLYGGQREGSRSEEHTSELQSHVNLVCRDLHSFPTRRSSDLR